MKLYIDFDGVIVNTIKAIVSLYDEDFKYYDNYKKIDWTDINSWDFTELKATNSFYINTYFNQQRFFDTVEFMPNAKEILEDISKRHDITIVSTGNTPNLKAKALWINQNIPYAKFIGVNLKDYSDKSHIDMSDGFLIDDSASNLASSNAILNICFGDKYTWNDNWNGFRIYNWTDMMKFIEDIEKKEYLGGN